MKKYIKLLFYLTLSHFISAQTPRQACSCGNNNYSLEKDDTSFNFFNGESLALCHAGKGTFISNDKISYEGFLLYDCRPGVLVDEYFDLLSSYLVSVNRDTLIIEQVSELPVGKNFEFLKSIWKIEKIFYVDGNLKRRIFPNRRMQKYSPKMIDSVKKDYEHRTTLNGKEVEELFYRLLIGAISGDEQSYRYFIDFPKKFPLDGAYAESYNGASKILELYKGN